MGASGLRLYTILAVLLFPLQGCLSAVVNDEPESTDSSEELGSFTYPDPSEYTCFDHDGWERCYQTYIPSTVNASSNVPLILELHGWAMSAPDTRAHSEIMTLADEVGAIVVHPEGILIDNTTLPFGGNEESWNAGYCCGDALDLEIDDVGYLLEVIEQTSSNYPVDTDRIYLSGWSNGCMMAQRMALVASEVIAAIACTSGYLSYHEPLNYQPIPILEIHGFLDENTPYTNTITWGIVDENRRNLESMQSGAVENMYDWAEYNGCEGALPDRNEPGTLYSIQGFTDCVNGAEVALITVHAGGHNLYANDLCSPDVVWNCFGNQGLYDPQTLMWDFLSQFSKDMDEPTEG